MKPQTCAAAELGANVSSHMMLVCAVTDQSSRPRPMPIHGIAGCGSGISTGVQHVRILNLMSVATFNSNPLLGKFIFLFLNFFLTGLYSSRHWENGIGFLQFAAQKFDSPNSKSPCIVFSWDFAIEIRPSYILCAMLGRKGELILASTRHSALGPFHRGTE